MLELAYPWVFLLLPAPLLALWLLPIYSEPRRGLRLPFFDQLAHAIGETPAPGALEWALIMLAILSFGLVALAQATLPLWSRHPAAQGLRVHLSNGLYINAIEDRLLGNWSLAGKQDEGVVK